MTLERGNRAPSGIDVWLSGNWPISPTSLPKARMLPSKANSAAHEYQRELTVGTTKTTIPQRVSEIRVDSALKLDRAAKRESADENLEEVPR
jgi:hypothetical protein